MPFRNRGVHKPPCHRSQAGSNNLQSSGNIIRTPPQLFRSGGWCLECSTTLWLRCLSHQVWPSPPVHTLAIPLSVGQRYQSLQACRSSPLHTLAVPLSVYGVCVRVCVCVPQLLAAPMPVLGQSPAALRHSSSAVCRPFISHTRPGRCWVLQFGEP